MRTGRLEAFSDGVLAIIITIMVLELHKPEGETLVALGKSVPSLLTYLLSFVYVGIYWNNHHHMLQLTHRVNGRVLWANLNLLFWLSLYPFTTSWMDETHLARTPVVVYGINLLLAAMSYFLLQRTILNAEGQDSLLLQAIGRDYKGKASPIIYLVGIALCFVDPRLGLVPFVVAAIMWVVPDRRLEGYIAEHGLAD